LVGHSDGGRGDCGHEYGYAEDEGKIFVSGGVQTKAKNCAYTCNHNEDQSRKRTVRFHLNHPSAQHVRRWASPRCRPSRPHVQFPSTKP
jgi:hypothetical protein